MYSLKQLKWSFLHVIKFLFIAIGKSWNDFYGWMLNYQDRHIAIEDILRKKSVDGKYKGLWDWQQGEYFYNFIKKHGYKDHQTIFDIGCGYGRLAIPILKNQVSGGKYIGSELSNKRISLAEDWIKREKLTDRNYELLINKDTNLDFIKDNSLECFTAFSVFNHMPDREFEAIIKALHSKLKPGGIGFCHVVSPVGNKNKGVHVYKRTETQMIEVFTAANLVSSELDDYDISKFEHSSYVRMFKVVKARV